MKRYLVVLALLLPLVAAAQPFDSDTIGGTTYDWGANGPSLRQIYSDDAFGIHASWMFSISDDPAFPDRNMRYNFYDNAASQWVFNQGSNFMDFGVNVYSARNGYGTIDVNPATNCAYISGHEGNIYPTVAKDAAPGSGTFEVCSGSGGPADQYLWPSMSITADEKVHFTVVDNASRGGVYYSRVDPWCTWSTPEHISDVDPAFDDHYMEASRRSNKLGVSWTNTDAVPYQMYYRQSNDGGTSWEAMVTLQFPPAYTPGSDTQPSFHLSGGAFLWDENDNMHLVSNIMPVVGGTGYIIPCEIWHYSPSNNPDWTKVVRTGCDTLNLMAGVGYNALYAARPMLAVDAANNLYCVWEQFDSMNVESSTALMRADLFACKSADNGLTWGAPVKLTVSGTSSHRYPSLARDAGSSIHVAYIDDQCAGQFVQGLGPVTQNPIVYLEVPTAALPGGGGAVGENPNSNRVFVPRLAVSPNPFGASTRISYELSRAGNSALRVYDASGHLVRTLLSGNLPTGMGTVVWNGTNDLDKSVAGGIYFARLETPDRVLSQKVILSR